MGQSDGVCQYWDVDDCEGTRHCPPRCPRFVDRSGVPWTVRPATHEDRPALVAMYDDFAPGQAAQGLPPRTRSRIEEWLDEMLAEGCSFVVAGGNEIVGHALYTPTGNEEPEFAIFVHQEYQDQGIGTELSKHVIATASVADRDALTLTVDPYNRAARNPYDALSFEIVEQLSFGQRSKRTEVIRMRCRLDGQDGIEYQRPLIAQLGRHEQSP